MINLPIFRGEAHPLSKLTEATVKDVLARRKAGETTRAIGKRHGIASATVSKICRGQRWAHVTRAGMTK